ncbi:PREDICTED: putative nuclease HARBI1 isoform X1 [Rhagoletis zephyria]|nr:PREDICTED: putative nuclease HARBI1 isoform X1 [Rhagoletis zephyria]XP_036342975.1 protein ALP1-like isoform X1 [Rhagoletis pomonella]
MEFSINILLDNFETDGNFLMIMAKKRMKRIKKRNWMRQELCRRRNVTKTVHFFKTIKLYPNDIYFTHFRMSRETFSKLKTELEPFFSNVPGEYSLEQSLHITLWKLGNSRVTYRELSDRFGIGKGTAHKVFFKTVEAICKLKNEISWPSASQQTKIIEDFQESRVNSFPFVVGCLDGTHFHINTPRTDAISYYDRKGSYSIIMQAICDSAFRFLDVFIGFPGSCHDANVWKNSPLYKGIASGQIHLAKDAVILADSAYPLSKYIMVPYRDNGHLSREEKQFNYYLSSTRVFIEQAFGILRQKFKILNHIDVKSQKDISKVVLACSILHNFIIRNSTTNFEVENTFVNLEDGNNPEIELPENINDTNEGVEKRNNLKMLFVS